MLFTDRGLLTSFVDLFLHTASTFNYFALISVGYEMVSLYSIVAENVVLHGSFLL